MGFDIQCFTTNQEQAYIHVIKKTSIKDIMQSDPFSLFIILTGWCNTPRYRSKRVYSIPYSLHSNYDEIVKFVTLVKPSVIYPIVSAKSTSNNQYSKEELYAPISYTEGLTYLRENLTRPLSRDYNQLLTDTALQKKIKEKLDTTNKNQIIVLPYAMENRPRKGYRIDGERDEEEIQRVKKKVQRGRNQRSYRKDTKIKFANTTLNDQEAIKCKRLRECFEQIEPKKKLKRNQNLVEGRESNPYCIPSQDPIVTQEQETIENNPLTEQQYKEIQRLLLRKQIVNKQPQNKQVLRKQTQSLQIENICEDSQKKKNELNVALNNLYLKEERNKRDKNMEQNIKHTNEKQNLMGKIDLNKLGHTQLIDTPYGIINFYEKWKDKIQQYSKYHKKHYVQKITDKTKQKLSKQGRNNQELNCSGHLYQNNRNNVSKNQQLEKCHFKGKGQIDFVMEEQLQLQMEKEKDKNTKRKGNIDLY